MTAGPVVAYIDGGARGNPGPAGFGVRVENADGSLVEEFHEAIGTATNNIAEYRGLLAALEWAKTHGHRSLHVRSDSLLLVQQMLGNYKVKNAGLQPLHAKAQRLAGEIGRVTFEHVRRESNAHADRLANEAMDGAPATAPASPASAPVFPSPSASAAGTFGAIAHELRAAIDAAASRMRVISDAQASVPYKPGKWTRKEILGHLIDSAGNNHQRFVRAQQESRLVFPGYDQMFWVNSQGYATRGWPELVALWESFNRHLAYVIERIPDEKQHVECRIGEDAPVTLGFLAADYVDHLRHHLAQLVGPAPGLSAAARE